jgi:hypothetical protein
MSNDSPDNLSVSINTCSGVSGYSVTWSIGRGEDLGVSGVATNVIMVNGQDYCLSSGPGTSGTQLVVSTCGSSTSQTWNLN